MAPVDSLAIDHLLVRLRPLNRALRAATARQRQRAARLFAPEVTPLCVTDDHVNTLLGDVDTLCTNASDADRTSPLTPADQDAERDLRTCAAAADFELPLDRLTTQLHLSSFEQEALVVCAAPEVDRSYERIYAYILDDLNRRLPCVELLVTLTASGARDQAARRRALGRFGILQRAGLVRPWGEAPTFLRQELRLTPAALEFLLGQAPDALHIFKDPVEIEQPAGILLPPDVDRQLVARVAAGLRERSVSAVGIWDARHGSAEDVALAVAAGASRPLRILPPLALDAARVEFEAALRDTLLTAAALDAILWIRTEVLPDTSDGRTRDAVVEALARVNVPVILTGASPWRPTRLLRARRYVEIPLPSPTYAGRKAIWSSAFPELPAGDVEDLAARFPVGHREAQAVARILDTMNDVSGNGHDPASAERIVRAAGTVVRARAESLATLVFPARAPDDLVLPREVHRQVLEVGRFYRAMPRVVERWGLGRLVRGGGFRALFIGDSGTGKTLAAEVVAGTLGLPLLKVDLARIVSKWVGETEKNLHTAFDEADGAALFFDEADALFGKRGEVRHGTDRYANLEVSYLLQRLEDYDGLVILASNLKDQIDEAFTRRFEAVIHFPRPGAPERRRIWMLALPPTMSDAGEALDALTRLDMTGASIVGAARTAALLAADEGADAITAAYLVRGVARQFRREARVLTPGDLGPYAALLQGLA